MMCRPKEIAVTLLDLTKEIKNTYENNKKEIDKLESEQLDLLHEIEFAVMNAPRRIYLLGELRSVRQKRRRLKNENEMLKFLYDTVVESCKFEGKMQKVLNNIEKTKDTLNKRKYYARVRNDLTISEETQLEHMKEVLESKNVG